MAKQSAPDYLPIISDRMDQGKYVGHYDEREITEPVALCDAKGLLNPAAIGWSRRPLQRCNLRGHWPRKKKWNFWCMISPDFAFSVTLMNLDYLGAAANAFLIDFKTKKRISATASSPLVRTGALPEEVEKDISFISNKFNLSMIHSENKIKVDFACRSLGGEKAVADFSIIKPAGHETLNVVIPWTPDRFQFTSKQNTLPTEGFVKVGDKRYVMDPKECHAVLDFGRGMWPYRTYWNWGAITGVQGSDIVGLNLGAKWTTGTGANENGICFNGKLTKIMEDMIWEYDPNDWMKPWRVRTGYTDMVNVTLTPIFPVLNHFNLGILEAGGAACYGSWSGTLKFEGRVVEINKLMGWGEEIRWKW